MLVIPLEDRVNVTVANSLFHSFADWRQKLWVRLSSWTYHKTTETTFTFLPADWALVNQFMYPSAKLANLNPSAN